MTNSNNWNDLNDQQDDDLSAMLQPQSLSKPGSQNPLMKIKKNLRINIIFASVICLLYIIILVYFQLWQVQLSIGLVLLFSLWALYTAFQQFRTLATLVSPANPLLAELKRHHQSINRWMNTQQKVALFIYPVSAAGGFMLGGFLGSGKPIDEFMSKPAMQIALLVSIIVLVPVCYYLSRWMCRQSFGKHLDALGKNITALEAEK